MKWFLILVCLPSLSYCQTVHMQDGRIVYKDSINSGLSFQQLHGVIDRAMKHTGNKDEKWFTDSLSEEITVNATMKLKSDLATVNRLQYQLKFSKNKEGYHFQIDSVKLLQNERGYKTTTVSSEALIKNLDNTGPVASASEKQLNEIDMRIQQLIDLLHNYSK